MKNHVMTDGKLLQTNKKWSHLTCSQREWIYKLVRAEHDAYVKDHGRLPMKKAKQVIANKVYNQIAIRGIWIPFGEADTAVCKCIDRANRKSPLFVHPKKKKTQSANSEDIETREVRQ